MSNSRESNVGRMRELVDFGSIYSSLARQVILKTSFRDTLESHGFAPENFPDVTMTMKLEMAKDLIAELQRNVDAIEAGMEHPSLRLDIN